MSRTAARGKINRKTGEIVSPGRVSREMMLEWIRAQDVELRGAGTDLYERLILSCRWASVDLGRYRLLANPPGPDLKGLLRVLSRDPALWEALLPAGYIPFGKGPDMDYDPVCFDVRHGRDNRDCRVVKIDHEQILCYNRVKVVAELAPSFRELVQQTIRDAQEAIHSRES